MTCNQQHRCSPDHAHSRLHNFAYRNGEGVGDREGGERGQVLISCKGGKGPWHRRKHCFGGIFASRAGDLAPREIDLQPRLTLGCLKVKTWHKDTNGSALYMNLINLTGRVQEPHRGRARFFQKLIFYMVPRPKLMFFM